MITEIYKTKKDAKKRALGLSGFHTLKHGFVNNLMHFSYEEPDLKGWMGEKNAYEVYNEQNRLIAILGYWES